MKKTKEYKHKLKSEISNADGAWCKEALDMSDEMRAAIEKIISKYEGKISTVSIGYILHNSVTHTLFKINAFSVNFDKRKSPKPKLKK